jgi:mono/diheme cytochrome c family protein
MLDMHGMDGEWASDAGTPVFVRNAADPDDFRSGPKFEWNGPQQELTRIPGVNGSFTQLDPAYFIYNKSDFVGNVANGDKLYPSKCGVCHGLTGEGDGTRNNTGVAINGFGYFTRYTRSGVDQPLANGVTHPGAGYWVGLTTAQKDDIIARLRGMSSVPGVAFQTPAGSAADIRAYSNVLLGRVDESKDNPGYKVLIVRKLQTGNTDDVQFNLDESLEYDLDIYLTDDDDLNLVGELQRKLTFKK